MKKYWLVIKDALGCWSECKISRMAAALAFYTALSAAPLIVIALALAGLVYGEQAAAGELATQIQSVVGRQGGEAIQAIVKNAGVNGGGTVALIIGFVVLFVSASGVFVELQDSLDTIWGVTERPGNTILNTIKDRILSFAMVLGIGFLLLVSLVVSAALNAAAEFVGVSDVMLVGQALTLLISFGVITVLFALIFKVLPDVEVGWGDVWIGAALTTLLFVIGKFLIGLYLGHSSVGSAYGAAGSLIVFLVWVYYSAQIVLTGAAFTRAYARRIGSRVRPSRNAVALTAEARARQGIPTRKTRASRGR